jgi:hypothetical protein
MSGNKSRVGSQIGRACFRQYSQAIQDVPKTLSSGRGGGRVGRFEETDTAGASRNLKGLDT